MAEQPDFWEVTWKFEDDSFETLRALGKEQTYKARATVFAQDDKADGMYLVLDGFALVIATDPDTGISHTVGIVTQGQSFGELGLLVEQPRLATVAAGTDLRVLKITPKILASLESDSPKTASVLYKTLARTLAEQLISRGNLLGGAEDAQKEGKR